MSTISNAVWELQFGTVIAAAELASALPLTRMLEVTEVAAVAPPTLSAFPARDKALRAPLADQQALVQAALNLRTAYENLVGEPSTH